MIVVDETIAGFVNVEVLPLADVVVSSLTKVFSGDSNVMGGRLVHYLYLTQLKYPVLTRCEIQPGHQPQVASLRRTPSDPGRRL